MRLLKKVGFIVTKIAFTGLHKNFGEARSRKPVRIINVIAPIQIFCSKTS